MENFSQAADKNKGPILNTLSEWLASHQVVLEIGSGSGQHAVHFTTNLKDIVWQPTEHPKAMPILVRNIFNHGNSNILKPKSLDLALEDWPTEPADCIYSANVVHIVSETLVEKLIHGASKTLSDGGLLALYGPFKYRGKFTTDSNEEFDRWLKIRNRNSGVRDFEWLQDLALDFNFQLVENRSMPANNQFLAYKRL